MQKRTKEQKQALKEAEKLFFRLSNSIGERMAQWAFRRVLGGVAERNKLVKEKSLIESRLQEIDRKL